MEELFLQEGKICIRKNVFQDKKKTIIFVHGLSGNLSAWSEYEKIFQKNYNIIMYDLRGHGKSLRYTSCDDYAIQNFSKDLNYIVKYFSIDKFLLVSHSFGTLVAIDYLLIHQEKIEKSIFLAPNFNVREKWLLSLIVPAISIGNIFYKILPPKYGMSHLSHDKRLYAWDWNILRMFLDIKNTGLLVYLFCIKQIVGLNYDAMLSQVTTPVLLIHGKNDTIHRAKKSTKIHSTIKNSKLVFLEKSNHFSMFNDFDEVAKNILDFLEN